MKEHSHLTPEQVDILLRGDLSPEAVRLAVRFLLAGCALCMETVQQAVLGPREAGTESRPGPRADA